MKKLFALFAVCLIAVPYCKAQTKKVPIMPGLDATVLLTPGSTEAKVMLPGMDTLFLDLADNGQAALRTIRIADYNFDGYKDFSVTSGELGNMIFDIFLFHNESKSFEPLELPGGSARCEHFQNVKLNLGEKELKSSCKAGLKPQTDVYNYTNTFNLNYLRSTGEEEKEKPEKEAKEKPERKTKDEDDE